MSPDTNRLTLAPYYHPTTICIVDDNEPFLASLELEYEIQSKITSAALKLASDTTASKSVRKQRKISYQQSQKKLKEIEAKLNTLKYYGTKHKQQQQQRFKQPRPHHQQEDEAKAGKDMMFHSGSVVNLSPLPSSSSSTSRDIRRGLSVPDLDASSRRDSPDVFEEDEDLEGDEIDASKSCPSSPRKHQGLAAAAAAHAARHQPDSVSLEPSSPHRYERLFVQ